MEDDTPSVIDELAEDLGFGDYLGEYEDDETSHEEQVHDQLPDVESYRAQMGHDGRSPTLTKSIFIAVCSFIFLTAILAIIVSVLMNNGEPEPATVVFEDDFKNPAGPGDWYMGETQRFLKIREYVTSVRGISTFDSVQALGDAKSPQYKAAQWMAHALAERIQNAENAVVRLVRGDGMKMEVPDFDKPDLEFDERYAMAVFYFATGGPSWTAQLNFLSRGHICTWNEAVEAFDGFAELRYGLTECPPGPLGEKYPRALIFSKYERNLNMIHFSEPSICLEQILTLCNTHHNSGEQQHDRNDT